MKDPRFTDTRRAVISETKGGADRVFLSCGHEIVVPHRAAPRKFALCHGEGCRVWRTPA